MSLLLFSCGKQVSSSSSAVSSASSSSAGTSSAVPSRVSPSSEPSSGMEETIPVEESRVDETEEYSEIDTED
ncbi:MAG: hypothetical protein IJS37_02150 [Bacilli bacterium]|nr:hypothetical protein [Bacilli bacterium]